MEVLTEGRPNLVMAQHPCQWSTVGRRVFSKRRQLSSGPFSTSLRLLVCPQIRSAPGREKNQILGAPLVRICVGNYPVQASMMKYDVLCLSCSNHVRNLNNQGVSLETVLISWPASLVMSTFLLLRRWLASTGFSVSWTLFLCRIDHALTDLVISLCTHGPSRQFLPRSNPRIWTHPVLGK